MLQILERCFPFNGRVLLGKRTDRSKQHKEYDYDVAKNIVHGHPRMKFGSSQEQIFCLTGHPGFQAVVMLTLRRNMYSTFAARLLDRKTIGRNRASRWAESPEKSYEEDGILCCLPSVISPRHWNTSNTCEGWL